MALVLYLRSTNSDLTGGNDFSKVIDGGTSSSANIAQNTARSATEVAYGFTPANFLSDYEWTPGAITVVARPSASSTNMYLKVSASRITSSGAFIETTGQSNEIRFNSTSAQTMTIPSYSWGTPNSTDRLRINYSFRNASTKAVTMNLSSNTVDAKVTLPFEEITVRQYDETGLLQVVLVSATNLNESLSDEYLFDSDASRSRSYKYDDESVFVCTDGYYYGYSFFAVISTGQLVDYIYDYYKDEEGDWYDYNPGGVSPTDTYCSAPIACVLPDGRIFMAYGDYDGSASVKYGAARIVSVTKSRYPYDETLPVYNTTRGNEYVFCENKIGFTNMQGGDTAYIGNNKVIFTYTDYVSGTGVLKLIVATIGVGSSITFGTPITISSTTLNSCSLSNIDGSRVLLSYNGDSSAYFAIVSVSGDALSVGTPYEIGQLSFISFVQVHYQADASSLFYSCITGPKIRPNLVGISGTTITNYAAFSGWNTIVSLLSTDRIDDTSNAVAFTTASSPRLLFSVSSKDVKVGPEVDISGVATTITSPNVISMENNTFAFVYRKNNQFYGKIYLSKAEWIESGKAAEYDEEGLEQEVTVEFGLFEKYLLAGYSEVNLLLEITTIMSVVDSSAFSEQVQFVIYGAQGLTEQYIRDYKQYNEINREQVVLSIQSLFEQNFSYEILEQIILSKDFVLHEGFSGDGDSGDGPTFAEQQYFILGLLNKGVLGYPVKREVEVEPVSEIIEDPADTRPLVLGVLGQSDKSAPYEYAVYIANNGDIFAMFFSRIVRYVPKTKTLTVLYDVGKPHFQLGSRYSGFYQDSSGAIYIYPILLSDSSDYLRRVFRYNPETNGLDVISDTNFEAVVRVIDEQGIERTFRETENVTYFLAMKSSGTSTYVTYVIDKNNSSISSYEGNYSYKATTSGGKEVWRKGYNIYWRVDGEFILKYAPQFPENYYTSEVLVGGAYLYLGQSEFSLLETDGTVYSLTYDTLPPENLFSLSVEGTTILYPYDYKYEQNKLFILDREQKHLRLLKDDVPTKTVASLYQETEYFLLEGGTLYLVHRPVIQGTRSDLFFRKFNYDLGDFEIVFTIYNSLETPNIVKIFEGVAIFYNRRAPFGISHSGILKGAAKLEMQTGAFSETVCKTYGEPVEYKGSLFYYEYGDMFTGQLDAGVSRVFKFNKVTRDFDLVATLREKLEVTTYGDYIYFVTNLMGGHSLAYNVVTNQSFLFRLSGQHLQEDYFISTYTKGKANPYAAALLKSHIFKIHKSADGKKGVGYGQGHDNGVWLLYKRPE